MSAFAAVSQFQRGVLVLGGWIMKLRVHA